MAPRPDAGDGAHQRRLAGARLAADQHALALLDDDFAVGDQRLAVGPRDAEAAEDETIVCALTHVDARPLVGAHRILEIGQREMQHHDAVGRGAPVGELREVVDQPGQRPLHARKSLRRLHQTAQRNLARQVARQCHHQRNDGRQIGERGGQQRKAALAAGLVMPGAAEVAQVEIDALALVGLAAHQRYALGILAGTDEAGAEIGLARLADVARLDEVAAEEVGHRRADDGVDHSGPDHVARDRQVIAEHGHAQRAGQHPEDAEEDDELQDALQDRLGELDGVLGRDADVLGDAAVGIVAIHRQQAELVLPPGFQPAAHGRRRQPAPPIDLQPPLYIDGDAGADTARHDDKQQNPQAGR